MPENDKLIRSPFDGLSQALAQHKRANASWPPAVVASVFQTGLNLMRDLEQKGIPVVGVDCNPENPGFRSKYGRSFLCPNPDKDPDGWLAFMLSLSAAIGEKPVLVPASDIFVSAIGRHAQALSEHFIFSVAGATLQASLATKETQYALAKQKGFPSPQAVYVQSLEELEEFCKGARFPVLLKPRHHREWQALPPDNPLHGHKTVSANGKLELLTLYNQVSAIVPEAVAQEEIVGPDSAKYCYLSVYATDGHRLGSCVVHEMRAYPLLYGCATMVEPVMDDEIDTICNQFLTSLGYIGICEIEVKRDTRDGRVLLIEVNPRYSGTGDCARYIGVETGFLHYLDLIGETPPPAVATRFDFRHVMLCADMAAFPKYREQGLMGWKEWLRSYRGPLKYFDFDVSDTSNARRTALKAARALVGGLLGRGRT
jgi:D-aspartate ligase